MIVSCAAVRVTPSLPKEDRPGDVHVLYVGTDACVFVRRHLGGEVPVEDALAVQILQSSGDVQSQAEPHAPRQVHVAVQQLLQVTAVDVLDHQKQGLKVSHAQYALYI